MYISLVYLPRSSVKKNLHTTCIPLDIFKGILNALTFPYRTLSSQRKSLSKLSTMERKSYPSTKMQKNFSKTNTTITIIKN